jgi:UDP-glucose 4-epimerase
MIDTFIVGTGNLSNTLKKKIDKSNVCTAKKFLKDINLINQKKKINLIINSFYSSARLKKIDSYSFFTNKSIFQIAKILDLLNPKVINKIIYTSSSSVYGSLNKKTNLKDDNNRNIYAAFKFSAELLIKNFCEKNNIKFIICRLFNMYGENDNFSIVQKLQTAKRSNQKVVIFNNGKSVRDYIHIDDVVTIYERILKTDISSGFYDVGTGKGVSLIGLIKKLNLKKENIVHKKKFITEISRSIANNKNLIKKIKRIEFQTIDDYLCK